MTLLTVSLSSRAAAVSSLLRYRTTVLALKATHWSRPGSALRTSVLPHALRSRHARAPDHSSSTSHLPGASHVARHVARAGAWSAALSIALSFNVRFPAHFCDFSSVSTPSLRPSSHISAFFSRSTSFLLLAVRFGPLYFRMWHTVAKHVARADVSHRKRSA